MVKFLIVTLLILTICLTYSCSTYNRSLKDMVFFGGYKTSYFKNETISADSVMIRLELFLYKDKSAVDFRGPGFSLDKYPHKRIEGNICEVVFKRDEVPIEIVVELKKMQLYPVSIWKPKLKANRHMHYKLYMTDDMRGVI